MTDTLPESAQALRERVRAHYAAEAATVTAAQPGGAGCCGPRADGAQAGAKACCAPAAEPEPCFGQLYDDEERRSLPQAAVQASRGCGNPMLIADLRPGEAVLDLGSGGGIDVLLSARRVGPSGKAYGLDMTDEMLDLARRNAASAGASNVEFLKGHIEQIPLPDASVDVVISNCVINLSVDKPAVFAEVYRVLRPGGRVGVADVVAEDTLTPEQRAERGGWAECAAGALSRGEYLSLLNEAGFTDAAVTFTAHEANGLHPAFVRAARPAAMG